MLSEDGFLLWERRAFQAVEAALAEGYYIWRGGNCGKQRLLRSEGGSGFFGGIAVEAPSAAVGASAGAADQGWMPTEKRAAEAMEGFSSLRCAYSEGLTEQMAPGAG